MKAFFEEYGFVLVSIVVVIALIGIVPSVSTTMGGYLKDMPYKLDISGTTSPTVTFNADGTAPK